MIRKIFYKFYNLINKGEIERFYREIRFRNETMQPYNKNEFSEYLKFWGFKEDLAENPLMGKEEVIRWCEQCDAYKKAHSFTYTGGSMGNPLKFPYSRRRAYFKTASIKFYLGLINYSVGDAYLMVRAKQRNRLIQRLRNETIILPTNLSKGRLMQIIKIIQRKRIMYYIGYPSYLTELGVYVLENKINLKCFKGIICISEPLHPYQYEIISKAFNCIILSRYSNEEVGVIAHQRTPEGDYIVDRGGVVVEVLDPLTLEPVKEGMEGKVVVTDLNSDLVPMVRYDTGDNAIVSQYKDGQLYSLKKVTGREAEKIYTTKGVPVSPLSLGPGIYKPFSDKHYNLSFQFVQMGGKDYELRIKSNEEKIDNQVVNEILNNIRSILGVDATVNICFNKSFKQRKSGKMPIYFNETNESVLM
ncbi:MAG: hypothetical protein JW870_05190 [Candidatus Delongbacteria bacterium]|nr:hypothetical protein [Candidatus Delongbacteria bacterium]